MSIRIDGTNTTANPGITGGDADTGLQFGTDEVKVVTGGSDRMVVDSSGNVGIGTTSPGKNLDIEASDPRMRLSSNASNNATVELLSNAKTSYIYSQNSGNLNLQGNGSVVFLSNSGTEAARIDTSQRLLVGTSSARSDFASTTAYRVQVEGTDLAGSSLSLTRNSNSNAGPGLQFAKSRASANGGNVIVQNNDVLAYILFDGNDGADFARAAQITAEVDGTPGTNDMPGRLVFSTTADGASSPTEAVRIGSDQSVRTYATATALALSTAASAGTSTALIWGRHSASGVNTGTSVFYVWSNGNVQNTNNSYSAISDIKLKENIVDANSQWSDIKALQVRKYNFKEGQTHTQIGLVAQEVELVSPGLVTESPDRDEDGNDLGTVTKSVNYSVLYMKAVKALQEAMERIETLEANNADLLARISALEAN